MTTNQPNSILEHDWDEELIKQFGNARCRKCGIQYEYYQRNIASLTAWTKKEIDAEPEHYNNIMKSYKECVPRH